MKYIYQVPKTEEMLRINLAPYSRPFHYTCAAKGEISGLGKIKKGVI